MRQPKVEPGGGGFGTPGAINAVLVAMTLFEPGTMRIGAESRSSQMALANISRFLLSPYLSKFDLGCENFSLTATPQLSFVGWPLIGTAGS